MNREEAKAYFAGILEQTSDLSKEEKEVAMKVFDAERVRQAFIPTPDHNRNLDSERARLQEIQRRNDYLEKEWFPDAKSKHDAALAKLQQQQQLLSRYTQQYGVIDSAQDVTDAARVTGLSEEKVAELLNARLADALASRDRATLDFIDIREDYMETFKKRMPTKEFEKFVAEKRQSGNQDGLQSLYKEWIAPDLQKTSEAQIEARIKKAQDEAIRDYASRHNIPVDSRPKEVSILNHHTAPAKTAEGKMTGREAFLQGWDEGMSKSSA